MITTDGESAVDKLLLHQSNAKVHKLLSYIIKCNSNFLSLFLCPFADLSLLDSSSALESSMLSIAVLR